MSVIGEFVKVLVLKKNPATAGFIYF